jgi:hypothetical protein
MDCSTIPTNANSRYFITNLDYQRKRTDIFCTVLSTVLVATLFTLALFSFNKGNLIIHLENIYKANFPTDSSGNLCGVDFPEYNYIYFPNLNDIVLLI